MFTKVRFYEQLSASNRKNIQPESSVFDQKNNTAICEVIAYSQYLLHNYKIYLEDSIQWFFGTYLKENYEISNFIVHMPSQNTTYLEKIRCICPEIESILKQYNSYVKNHEIRHEDIEINSKPINHFEAKSLIKDKYIVKNKLNEKETIIKDKSSCLTLYDNKEKKILFDLFHNGFASTTFYKNKGYENALNSLKKKDLINYESSLLSKAEQDYFSYFLDKSKFENGLDLRNSYLHGTQKKNGSDEDLHKKNYYILLMLIILIALKIEDDLSPRKALYY